MVAAAAGYVHSAALKAEGTVWTWGYGGGGQLGANSTVDSRVPVQVPGLAGVAGIASGYHHIWRPRPTGRCGRGATTPTARWATGRPSSTTPPWSSPASRASRRGGGRAHLLRPEGGRLGAVLGDNADGEVADGTTTSGGRPTPPRALTGVVGLSLGPIHGLALTSTGSAQAWGNGANGALGNGSTANASTPVTVSTYNRGTAPKASYAYDGDGLRTKKTVAGTVTNYVWDHSGGVPLLLDDGANAYLYGPDGLAFEQVGPVTW